MTLANVTKMELLDLLYALVDGVDGYESETGDLRHWNEEKLERARQVIDQLIASA
jgi:hypothetical protein